MTPRTTEDILREEYFKLYPTIFKVLEQLETIARHCLLPFSLALKHHERIRITSRIKDCESAINKLRSREEGTRAFDPAKATTYTLTQLKDLAAIRVLVFPKSNIPAIHKKLTEQEPFHSWTADHILTRASIPQVWKYAGYCPVSSTVRAEIQIAPMILGQFLDIEHDAIYKPLDPTLQGARRKGNIQESMQQVYEAFDAFETAIDAELNPPTDLA